MKTTALTLSMVFTLAGISAADILYNNGLVVPTPSDVTQMIQAMSSDSGSFALSDDFDLTETVQLAGFRFTGATNGSDDLSASIGWGILGTTAGVPDTVLYAGTDTHTSQNNFETHPSSGVKLYEVEGSFGQSITLSPGRYHFAIKEGAWGSATYDGSWAYIVFDPATETLGPRGYVSFDEFGAPTIGSQGEAATGALAFELTGVAIPEPSSILMASVALGAVGMVGMLSVWRRR